MDVNPSIRRVPRALPALLALALACGCNPETGGDDNGATVRGRVSDGNGSQYARLGGTGSIDAAVTAQAFTLADDGSLHAIGSGTVEADGTFSFDVPSGESPVIVQALSADSEVVASAILESTGEEGDRVTCTPLDTESSLEAEVLIAMVAESGSVDGTNPVDLRLRIDSGTAVEVRATFEDEGDTEGEAAIGALAEATLAAQATELAAWSQQGFETTQQAMFALEIEASQQLSLDLYDGSSATTAWADFTASLSATLASESEMSESDQAECESQSSLAFRLVINGRLEGSDVAWEATQAAAWTEAQAEANAAVAIFAAADASSQVQDQCEQAGDELVTSVSAAASTAALVESWGDFQGSLVGETTVEGSALGSYLGVSGGSALVVDATLATCEESAGTLEDVAWTNVHLLLINVGVIDTQAIAAAVVEAWASHRAAVEAAIGDSIAIPSEDAQVTADITVLATAGFRAAE